MNISWTRNFIAAFLRIEGNSKNFTKSEGILKLGFFKSTTIRTQIYSIVFKKYNVY